MRANAQRIYWFYEDLWNAAVKFNCVRGSVLGIRFIQVRKRGLLKSVESYNHFIPRDVD